MTDQLRTVDQSFDYPELVPLRGTEFLARAIQLGADMQAETDSLTDQSPEAKANIQSVRKATRAMVEVVIADAVGKQLYQLEAEGFAPSDPNIDLPELVEKTRQLIEAAQGAKLDTSDWEARLAKVKPEAFQKELRNRVEALEALVERNDEDLKNETKQALVDLLAQAEDAGVDQKETARYLERIIQASKRNARIERLIGRAWKQATSLFRKK